MARRSAADIGLTVARRSTKSRYPVSVGTRPALVCGCVMYPSSSRVAMSLRIVAGETPQRVPLGERLGPDRLARRDVVLDDGAQNRQLALVEHGYLRRRADAGARLALSDPECQV